MGIKLSTNKLIEESFDGESGDYNVDASNYMVELSAEWFVGKEHVAKLKEELKQLATVPEKVNLITLKNRIVAAKCTKVYDGDTAHFVIKYDGDWVKFRCRMVGYNSAEMRPNKSLPLEERKRIKAQAIKDRDYLADILLDKYVVLHLHDFDKYGRPLTDVYLIDEIDALSTSLFEDPTKHVNALMIKYGHGVSYDGHSSKKKFVRVKRKRI